MDKQFFLDLAGNAAGLAEQVVPMVTGSIAEPVAGLAALYHAGAGGDDASGVVNAIREAMTYQPRTEAGKMYQQALSGAVERIVQSAPVRTWKQGVDIAGVYSPTAGAVLATVPTAIGLAAGAKPALRAGRSASEFLDKIGEFAPTKPSTAMGGMQKGMIDPSAFKIGDNVVDTKFGDTYEFLGIDPENTNRAILREGKSTFSIDFDRIGPHYSKPSKNNMKNIENTRVLYHGSHENIPEIQVLESRRGGGFDYGAIFASGQESAAKSHGVIYEANIPESSILDGGSAAYNLSKTKVSAALNKALDAIGANKKSASAYDAIVMDAEVGQDALVDIFGKGYDNYEYGLLQQKARAAFAKNLGYRAVTTQDEHGTSYMILPGESLKNVSAK